MRKVLTIAIVFLASMMIAQDKPKQDVAPKESAPAITASRGVDLTPTSEEMEKLKSLKKDLVIARQQKQLLEMQYQQVMQSEAVAAMQIVQEGQEIIAKHGWSAIFDGETLTFVPKPAKTSAPATPAAPVEKDSKQ